MKIETLNVELIGSEDKQYDATQLCQCCGEAIAPVRQANGIDYYYTVNDRPIESTCLEQWLGKIGQDIANDPHPRWLHAAINAK